MVQLKLAVPEDFFEEEIRCDHLVSRQMKEAWAVQLDLVSELERVCTKYGISYFAVGGTLLGTIRHKGFIPWDDDIDIMMMRDQYEKLCEIGPLEFCHPYFFQYITSESGYQYGYVHLRNSDTSSIEEDSKRLKFKFNQGIKIDIFPVDTLMDNEELVKEQLEEARRVLKIANNFYGCTKDGIYWHPSFYVRVFRKVGSLICSGIMRRLGDKYYRKYEKVCKRYNDNKDTEMVGLICLSSVMKGKCSTIPRYYLTAQQNLPFEFTTMRVGKDCEKALDSLYGDWRTPIKGTSLHSKLLFDTNKSYKNYI